MSDHIPDTGKMVPDTWMEAADRVLVPGKPMTTSDLRKALAAVAPLIAAAERERCARWHDQEAQGEDVLAAAAAKADDRSGFTYHRHTAATLRVSAAAIRALGDADG